MKFDKKTAQKLRDQMRNVTQEWIDQSNAVVVGAAHQLPLTLDRIEDLEKALIEERLVQVLIDDCEGLTEPAARAVAITQLHEEGLL